ncbi:MAG: hypothetical protein HYU66_19695, partial [Armatimonadetes bacterium]|nr:hypothetical protein [Armatimonadota bacterium]
MSFHVTPDQLRRAEEFVRRCHAHGELAPVDLDQFWAAQKQATADPWSADCPQMPLGMLMSSECVFDELGIPETDENWHRLTHDSTWRAEVCRAYNDRAEQIVGRRLLSEAVPDPSRQWPGHKGLHDIFEARNEWHGASYWLQQAAHGEAELRALLDRVDERLADLRAFVLPDGWEAAKERLLPRGIRPPLYRGQRGPVTFATSIYGAEDLIWLILDNPELAARLRDTILRAILELARVIDEEAGYTPETAPHGWGWADDNCCLLNPALYEFWGYPILKGVFDRYSPNPGDARGQHSDSDMAHLLPVLGQLGLTWANFGPTVRCDEIREHLPRALICGQLAPFTLSRNEEVNMVAELLRDHAMTRERHGISFATAGSINNGS